MAVCNKGGGGVYIVGLGSTTGDGLGGGTTDVIITTGPNGGSSKPSQTSPAASNVNIISTELGKGYTH